MEALLNWLAANYTVLALVLLALFGVSLAVFLVVIYRLQKLTKQYKILMRGVEGKNLEEIVLKNTKTLEHALFTLGLMEDRINQVEKDSQKALQKIGIVRFNAFNDVGGDLSYAIALLTQNNSGVVISSIYGRDDARTYAKPIEEGKSSYPLSSEEEEAIRRALKNSRNKN